MNLQETQVTPVTAQPTDQPITPLPSDNQLDPPFQNSATFDVKTGTLTYACSVMLPDNVSISNRNLQVQQYYDPTDPKTIQFYFVYNQGGTPASFIQQDFIITATPTYGRNNTPIPLGDLTTAFSLIEDQDPKTSRGTVTTVVHTGQP